MFHELVKCRYNITAKDVKNKNIIKGILDSDDTLAEGMH
jgi:hypothetical protein